MVSILGTEEGNFVYAASSVVGVTSSLEVEVWALQEDLKYCIKENWLPIILETNSLMAFNCISGIWEVPWRIRLRINRINEIRRNKGVEIKHILREGNKVTDYFANLVFFFASMEIINFQSIQQVPKQGHALLALDAEQIPKYSNNKDAK